MNSMNSMSMSKNSYGDLSSKPKAPLSAYNLFFQLARRRILDGTDHMNLPITLPEIAEVAAQHKLKTGKRAHRKTHGKISFRDLARTVAIRWRALGKESRDMLKYQAKLEKMEYDELFEQWRNKQENLRQEEVQAHQDGGFKHQVDEKVGNHGLQGIPETPQLVSLRLQQLGELRNQIDAEMNRRLSPAKTETPVNDPIPVLLTPSSSFDQSSASAASLLNSLQAAHIPERQEMTLFPEQTEAFQMNRNVSSNEGTSCSSSSSDELHIFLSSPIFHRDYHDDGAMGDSHPGLTSSSTPFDPTDAVMSAEEFDRLFSD